MTPNYVGQSFTLPIRWDPADADWTPLRTAFDARHGETFGYTDPANDIEIVNVRLVAIGKSTSPQWTSCRRGARTR